MWLNILLAAFEPPYVFMTILLLPVAILQIVLGSFLPKEEADDE